MCIELCMIRQYPEKNTRGKQGSRVEETQVGGSRQESLTKLPSFWKCISPPLSQSKFASPCVTVCALSTSSPRLRQFVHPFFLSWIHSKTQMMYGCVDPVCLCSEGLTALYQDSTRSPFFPSLDSILFHFSSLLLKQNKERKETRKGEERQQSRERDPKHLSSLLTVHRICIIWLPFLFVVLIQPVCLSVSPTVSETLNHLRKLCCPATLKRQTTQTTGLTLWEYRQCPNETITNVVRSHHHQSLRACALLFLVTTKKISAPFSVHTVCTVCTFLSSFFSFCRRGRLIETSFTVFVYFSSPSEESFYMTLLPFSLSLSLSFTIRSKELSSELTSFQTTAVTEGSLSSFQFFPSSSHSRFSLLISPSFVWVLSRSLTVFVVSSNWKAMVQMSVCNEKYPTLFSTHQMSDCLLTLTHLNSVS